MAFTSGPSALMAESSTADHKCLPSVRIDLEPSHLLVEQSRV